MPTMTTTPEHGLLTAPPTDDEREALLRAVLIGDGSDAVWESWMSAVERYPDSATAVVTRRARARNEHIFAAGFRRQGPITDAVVSRALVAFECSQINDEPSRRVWMRAALEAARAVS